MNFFRERLIIAGLLTGALFGCSQQASSSALPPAMPDSQPITQQLPVQETPTQTSTTQSLTSVPRHVMTGDYFDSPWGTTSVAPSRAVPYLNYVRTGVANATVLHDAGLRVQVYTNPNRMMSYDPLYQKTAPTAISKTCTSAQVYDRFAGASQYVGTPYNATLQKGYAELVTGLEQRGHIDQIFMDNTGALSDFGVAFYPTLPCSYSDSAWITGEQELADASPLPIIFNGLSGLHNEGMSLSVGVLNAGRVSGGEYEHCFSDNSRAEQGSWPWSATENTQLYVTSRSKQFHCQAVNTAAASSSYAARIYTIASFLMTYNPNYSILWEEFGTPSGLHVMPESGIVALNPMVRPSTVAALKQSGGSYVRIYDDCYYHGTLVGHCAMAVNPDYYSHPVVLTGFHHTLALAGNGVLDGGTVSFYGAPPPSTLAPTSAVVAFP